jgi:hypothetical protein
MLVGVGVFGVTAALAVVAPDASPGGTGWTRYDWNAASRTGEVARFSVGPGGLLHIASKAPDDARFVRAFAVLPATLYRLSCRVRTEGVGLSARGAGLSVSGILEGSPDVRGTSAWRTVEMYGTTGPVQRELPVTVGVGGMGA